MLFYKALFKKNLKSGFIPGTVTSDINEAYKWFRRYNSNKRLTYGICGGGIVVIIKFEFDETTLASSDKFQSPGVREHSRENCWTSSLKTKAQINTVINNYNIIDINTILNQLH